MDGEPYLILQFIEHRPLVGTQYRSDGHAPPTILQSQSVETLSPGQAAAAAKDPSLSVAPLMPIRLIRPLGRRSIDLDEPLESSAAWGIDAIGAKSSPFTGQGVTVAVLDTGIDAANPAFDGVSLELKDFTGEGDGDLNGHGTHCAGTIFGRPVNGVRIGVAQGVERALIAKVLDQDGGGNLDSIVRALSWCVESGADVICMSLGIDFPGRVARLVSRGIPVESATSAALHDHLSAVRLFERYAGWLDSIPPYGRGAVVVAAAGNESCADKRPPYRLFASPPASAPGLLSVGAVAAKPPGASHYPVAPFSNAGSVLAPGVGVISAKAGGGLEAMDGTSMAAPHVAGVAAQLLHKRRLMSQDTVPQSIREDVLSSANAEVVSASDPMTAGAGLISAPGL